MKRNTLLSIGLGLTLLTSVGYLPSESFLVWPLQLAMHRCKRNALLSVDKVTARPTSSPDH